MAAVQLLWLNLIMDTLAALALATDPPVRTLLERKPERKDAPFISVAMWKMIIGQAIFQLIIVFVMLFLGPYRLFGWLEGDTEVPVARNYNTVIFNTYVWMQIFNAFNCRRVDNRKNIFEGILNNWYFIAILAVMVGGQILIIFVGGQALQVTRLGSTEWIISIIPGMLCLPLGVLIRCIPDEWAVRLVPAPLRRRFRRKKISKHAKHMDAEAQKHGWEHDLFMNELKFLKKYKGGRTHSMRFRMSHPKESRHMFGGAPSVSALVAGTGVIAGSVGGVRA